TLDLTAVNEFDLEQIDSFLEDSEGWSVKVGEQYFDLSSPEAKKWIKEMKGQIARGEITHAEVETLDGEPALKVFRTGGEIGSRGEAGAKAAFWRVIGYEDSEVLSLGSKLSTFHSAEDAEAFA